MGVWLNQIETAVPLHDVHRKFLSFAQSILPDERQQRMFKRLAEKSQIDHRYSVIKPSESEELLDAIEFYRRGNFPSTVARMKLFDEHAAPLALAAARQCEGTFSHLIVTTCTGFSAPGLDLQLQRALNLPASVERTVIGFMGCYAALNGLKAAWHIVRSDPKACVLMVNLELCTLHLREQPDLESLLAYLQFADGCAASVLSARPRGLELKRFHCAILPHASDQITWHIGNDGFEMKLSPAVAGALGSNIGALISAGYSEQERAEVQNWAVHPGGRAILDAVEEGLALAPHKLEASRAVLRRFGNMSSATVMFVLRSMLYGGASGDGLCMSFGPGLTLESMLFSKP